MTHPALVFGMQWPTLSPQTPPGNGISGLPLLQQPVIVALTSLATILTTFVGLVTASIISGPGTIIAGATALSVLGIATFLTLTIQGAGTSVIQFSSSGTVSCTATVTIT